MEMKTETKQLLKKLIVTAIGILAVVGVVLLVMHLLGWDKMSDDELQTMLQEYIEEQGAVAPLIFILISFLQVTFVPIPGAVTILAGNYVFGMA